MAGRQYKNSKVMKKSYTFSFSTADLPRDKSLTRTSSDNSNLSSCKEIAAAMASFSIQDLLGLSNDSRGRTNGNINGGASSKSENGFAEHGDSKDAKSSDHATINGKPMQDSNGAGGPSTADANDRRANARARDEETLQEQENTQLVTVEVRTMHASSISRSSSRKRKRTGMGGQGCKEPAEQRDSTPESDGKLVHVL